MERPCADIPDASDPFIVAPEGCLVLDRQIFQLRRQLRRPLFRSQVDVAEGSRREHMLAVLCADPFADHGKLSVQRFLARFAVENTDLAHFLPHDELDRAEALAPEIIQDAAVQRLHADRRQRLIGKREDRRIVVRMRECRLAAHVFLPLVTQIGHPTLACCHLRHVAEDRREGLDVQNCDLYLIVSVRECDLLIQSAEEALLPDPHKALAARADKRRDRLLQIQHTQEAAHVFRPGNMPHCRIVVIILRPSAVQQHTVIKLKIAGIPDPFCAHGVCASISVSYAPQRLLRRFLCGGGAPAVYFSSVNRIP